MEVNVSDNARVDYCCEGYINELYPPPEEIVKRIEKALNGREDKNLSIYDVKDGSYRTRIRIPQRKREKGWTAPYALDVEIKDDIITMTDIILTEGKRKEILGNSKYKLITTECQ